MQLNAVEDRFAAALEGRLPAGAALGVAVSGGGDSMALLHLAASWARERGHRLAAVTVDHGLRPEAAAEAAGVGAAARALGVAHAVLRWNPPGGGNLQAAARAARQALIGAWAREAGLEAVLLGHTRDDQAETVLMRIARGGGVDGLSAMAPARRMAGMLWLRPLLGIGREELRDWLAARGIGWVEDPSNSDRRFQRTRAREALARLRPLGIDATTLAGLAARMGAVREALEATTAEALERHARTTPAGAVILDAALLARPEEIARRALAAAIRWIRGPGVELRGAALCRLLERRGGTLAGVRVERIAGGSIHLAREAAALEAVRARQGELWDGRWEVTGGPPDAEVRALGESGLARIPEWRAGGERRTALLATPALWRGEELLAAPLAGYGPGCAALRPFRPTPAAAALTH